MLVMMLMMKKKEGFSEADFPDPHKQLPIWVDPTQSAGQPREHRQPTTLPQSGADCAMGEAW